MADRNDAGEMGTQITATADWLIGGGDMGQLVRAIDWSRTPLGPRERWPLGMRAVVNLLMSSRSPMALLWGPELVLLYNDGCREVAGERDQHALGRSARETCKELWNIHGPILDAVLHRGEAVHLEDKPFPIDRNGRRENVLLTLSYSPVRLEDGSIAGALVTLQENTAQFAVRRRLEEERARALDAFEQGDSCYVLDSEFRYVLVNKAQERSSGKLRDQVLGRCIWDVWPEAADRRLKFWDVYHRVMRERIPETFEEYFQKLDLWVEANVVPTREGGIAVFFRRVNERKATERALKESEERLRLALDATQDAVWDIDVRSGTIRWNETYTRNFGRPASADSLEWWLDHVHEDDRERASHGLRAAIDSDVRSWSCEYRLQRTDGSWAEVLDRAVIARDEADRATRIVGAIADITQRKRGEETLRDRERLFRVLIENLHSAVALVDDSGRFTLYNSRFLELLGLPRDADIQNVNSQDWARWEVFDEGRNLLQVDEHPVRRAAVTLEAVRNCPIGVRPPRGGDLIWVLVSAVPLLDERGKLQHLICTFHDITDLKHTEETLRRREATLAQAGQMAHLGAWDIEVRDPGDFDSNRLTWSDEVYRIFGYEPRSVPISNAFFFQSVHPDDRERVAGAVAAAIAAKRPYSIEHRIIRPDGTERILQEQAEFVFNDRGTLVHVLGAVQDITERKIAEEVLRDADRRKSEFLAILSHELRNPLAPIRNSVYVLERARPGGEQANRARQVIDRQTQHMTRLIEDLLDVTRIARGKITIHREQVDIGALARRTAEDHREVYSRNGVDLQVDIAAAEPLWVDGDPTRLAQVIGNLLNNSAKFTPAGGRTVLSVECTKAWEVVLRVRDTGAGMAEDTLRRVFDPFVQATQTIERTRGGLGLGLALVKGLVEMHGGTVKAHSEGEGRGAEFTVTLPLKMPAKSNREETPAQPQRAPGRRRVLIIEDSVDAADTLREALEFGQHEVVAAYSGPEGLDKARVYKPDVVLCDIGLPGVDGYGVARALRSDSDPCVRSAFLIALSGYALPEDIAKSEEAGFDRHIAKPPRLDALESLLAEVSDNCSRAG